MFAQACSKRKGLVPARQQRPQAYHEVSSGTLTASFVHPREVFGPALRVLGVARWRC